MNLFQLHTKYWGKRLLFVLTISFLIFLVYFFKVPEIKAAGFILKNPLFDYTSSLTWKLYLTIYFTVVFLINTVFLISMTVFYKAQKQRHARLMKKYERYFIETIMDHLVLKSFDVENEEDPHIVSLKKALRDKNSINIFLDVLRKINAQVKGDLRTETSKMIGELGLHEVITTYLYSPYFEDKILAMKIISDFGIEEHNGYLLELTYNKNYVVRTEALDSLIKLSVLDNLEFLKNHIYQVSLWDINTILKISDDFEKQNIDYSGLINSEHLRVAALGILLAGKNERTDMKETIKSKLGSEDEVVNTEAYRAYLAMADQPSDFKYVMGKFFGEDEKIKQLIVESFKRCPDKVMSVVFLTNVVEKESLSLKTSAMKLLLEFDTTKFQYYQYSDSPEIIKAHNEAVDLYIN